MKINRIATLVLAFFCVIFSFSLNAETSGQEMVESVQVVGNQSISPEQILAVTRLRAGSPLVASVVNEDMKQIWKMGLFSDVKVDLEKGKEPNGVKIIYTVTERPVVKEIQFLGNKEISDNDLLEKSGLKEGEVYEQNKVAEAIDKLVKYYKEKDFYAVSIKTELKRSSTPGKVILRFLITEGFRMKIKKITVTGNKALPEARIKQAMQDTKETGWFNMGGSYDLEKLEDDLKRVLQAYSRDGYVKAKLEGYTLNEFPDHAKEVAEKVTNFDEERKQITISFHVDEGVQYHVRSLSIAGNTVYSLEEINRLLETRPDEVFNMERWEKDLSKLRSAYAEKGYIYANPVATYDYDDDQGLVDIKLNIAEGNIAYIEAIKIRGNEITKDKVIRREILIKPGEPFDSNKIAKSREKIYNLGFFENVSIDIEPGSEMDKQVLVFDVSPERKTGTLSLGAGYSSVEGLVGYLQVSQNNLFGNGQAISAQWEAGQLKGSYSLSFTEPWLLDTPTSFGVDLFKTILSSAYNNQGYDLTSTGGGIRLGRTLNPTWKTFLSYRYSSDDYENISAALAPFITSGINNVSSITPSITRDTRDNIFDASKGSFNMLSIELAGGYLGGDNNFIKPVYDGSVFFSTPAIFGWKWLSRFTLGLHGRVGYGFGFPAGHGNNDVPPSERFFVGGTDTVRGYNDRSLGSSPSGGGRFMLLSNIEYGFRPIEPLKLHVFYDMGNSWDSPSNVNWPPYVYPATGVGFLFTIPGSVIQIRLDWGYGLDATAPGFVPNGRVHFNIGNIF